MPGTSRHMDWPSAGQPKVEEPSHWVLQTGLILQVEVHRLERHQHRTDCSMDHQQAVAERPHAVDNLCRVACRKD